MPRNITWEDIVGLKDGDIVNVLNPATNSLVEVKVELWPDWSGGLGGIFFTTTNSTEDAGGAQGEEYAAIIQHLRSRKDDPDAEFGTAVYLVDTWAEIMKSGNYYIG